MLATYKNVIFEGHNHLLATGADDGHFDYQHHWLAGDHVFGG